MNTLNKGHLRWMRWAYNNYGVEVGYSFTEHQAWFTPLIESGYMEVADAVYPLDFVHFTQKGLDRIKFLNL